MAHTLDSLAAALRTSEPKLDLPMVIISAGKDWWGKPEIDASWRRSHRAMADASPIRRRVISKGSGHDIPHQDPEAVVSAVLSLLEAPGHT
jgi:pimeloyl-ACP methyl ester carboxylesterase